MKRVDVDYREWQPYSYEITVTCPHCGEDQWIVENGWMAGKNITVECDDCGEEFELCTEDI